MAGLILSVIAIVLTAASAWYAHSTVKQAQIANAFSGVGGIFAQYRNIEASRRFVLRELQSACSPEFGVSELPDEAREHVIRVLHFLDHLGVLVDRGLLDKSTVSAFMGGSVLRLWHALSAYVEVERGRRDEEGYQVYFEQLAVMMSEDDRRKKHDALKRFARPSD
jgi:hypothetical protein